MKKLNWEDIKYFKREEFVSPDTGEEQMNLIFVKYLEKLREFVGQPLVITSGFRTLAHNEKIGGTKNSAHLRGLAVDIACPDSALRYKILDFVLNNKTFFYNNDIIIVEIRRIGIGKNFIHLDCDKSLPQEVVWLY